MMFSKEEMKTAQLSPSDPAVVRIKEITSELIALAAQTKALGEVRRAIETAEAVKIADLRIGQEVDCEYGNKHQTRRYRITQITGRVNELYGAADIWFASVAYKGVLLKKDGSQGEESNLYQIVKIYPLSEQEQPCDA